MDKDTTRKFGKPGASSEQDSESVPSVGPHNRELGEIYQRLYPEMRRPKPNQEAIAAALQAMQRLTMEADSEAVSQESVIQPAADPTHACGVCGHQNRVGNKFCGSCGIELGTVPMPAPASPPTILETSPMVRTVEASMETRPTSAPPPSESSQPEHHADEVHPPAGAPAGTHHYHHHYHHHYFQGSNASGDAVAAVPRAPMLRRARAKPTG